MEDEASVILGADGWFHIVPILFPEAPENWMWREPESSQGALDEAGGSRSSELRGAGRCEA